MQWDTPICDMHLKWNSHQPNKIKLAIKHYDTFEKTFAKRKEKQVYLSVSCDWSESSGPTTCLSICDWYCSCFLWGGTQNGLPFNIGKPITESYSPWLEPQGSDLCADGCTLFGVTHGVDWIDFVKDSITLKETYNLTSDCIFPSFSRRAFPRSHCCLTVPELFIFLVCYISTAIYCL